MKVLGISASHDSGAALIEDGRIVAAVNEERLNRVKMFWGPPLLSIREVLKAGGSTGGDIDAVAISGIMPSSGMEYSTSKNLIYSLSRTGIVSTDIFMRALRFAKSRFRREDEIVLYLKRLGVDAPVSFVEHHIAHAASGYYTCPYKDPLIVTTDAAGDGLCSIVCTVSGGVLERRAETSFYHSPGKIYAYVTANMGYVEGRHEGKITGLAAYGDWEKTYPVFGGLMGMDAGRLQYRSRVGCLGTPAAKKVHMLMRCRKREDIASGVQMMLEKVCTRMVAAAAGRFGREDIVLAGGVFANVKLNQRISELGGIRSVFIHPHMGDGGLAVGSALQVWADSVADSGRVPGPSPIDNVYFGPAFSDGEIEAALKGAGLEYERCDDVEWRIAECVSKGGIVGRFDGRMEYGPRALGNRSILASPSDRGVNGWLNKRLRRTEFMPFAPAILKECAGGYFRDTGPGEAAAQFMTITYDATDECKELAPGIVHVDGTARPQTVTRKQNRSFHRILEEYKKLTGLPLMINTSFNMHEEPILCTPLDAARSLKQGSVDVLAIGDFLVSGKGAAHG